MKKNCFFIWVIIGGFREVVWRGRGGGGYDFLGKNELFMEEKLIG